MPSEISLFGLEGRLTSSKSIVKPNGTTSPTPASPEYPIPSELTPQPDGLSMVIPIRAGANSDNKDALEVTFIVPEMNVEHTVVLTQAVLHFKTHDKLSSVEVKALKAYSTTADPLEMTPLQKENEGSFCTRRKFRLPETLQWGKGNKAALAFEIERPQDMVLTIKSLLLEYKRQNAHKQ
ncbi:hypothetical protein NUW58_g1201 [Xylaria curta]|uniref:Uncharacterized protein n=1 Tax=Xylaria curta TaxID=42375 RepID=A0ACC1PPL4_9PEZI|nr:hypothetical protein NUW58_g1201 [Xylaria curta]